MADTVTYNGKTYTRVNGKWVDKNYMVVTNLQKVLDNIFSQQKPIDEYTVDELISEADKYKQAGTTSLAIKFYEAALEAETIETYRFVIPKLTSCYRAQGQAKKAIEVFEKAFKKCGSSLMSPPLCTSIAAAYCDIQEYIKAKKYADKAYAMGHGKISGELRAVYGRIRKETTESGAFD